MVRIKQSYFAIAEDARRYYRMVRHTPALSAMESRVCEDMNTRGNM